MAGGRSVQNGYIYSVAYYVQHRARKVAPVDTTGAGDTFTGFFLKGILDGKGPEEALKLATAASAMAVTRPGAADSIPLLEEVLSSGLA